MNKNITVFPSVLSGTVKIPASKSALHRAVICGFLSRGKTEISNINYNDDINATVSCVENLGADITKKENSIVITSIKNKNKGLLNCEQSGSTLRFLLPVSSALGGEYTFTGTGRLPYRPMKELIDILSAHGITCKTPSDAFLPLEVSGKLSPGEFTIPGNISSQYLSGLLFALPLLDGDSAITVDGRLESEPYVSMTVEMLSKFGIKIDYINKNTENLRFFISGHQKYNPTDVIIEGDWSQAAFFLAAGALNNNITCTDINEKTFQGDFAIIDILNKMGAKTVKNENGFSAYTGFGETVRGIDIDMTQIPDLLPPLVAVAAAAKGKTRFLNCRRLRLKESDRLLACAEEFKNIGAKTFIDGDSLIVEGCEQLEGGHASSRGDHRIAMALAIAATRCKNPVIIEGADSVSKSYPDFFKDFVNLGGVIT